MPDIDTGNFALAVEAGGLAGACDQGKIHVIEVLNADVASEGDRFAAATDLNLRHRSH
ncbi:hypothetical protein [Pseudomonas sp. A-B-19]|uniref:hypothetical protein n=1 Tax=Pseudomonas sp. A-B-19 TaxID=2832405 RepID=UPI001CC056CF|nr:hypothetical protein [Pseudomonas sp. A-B-19]